jgi:hypothetical protein
MQNTIHHGAALPTGNRLSLEMQRLGKMRAEVARAVQGNSASIKSMHATGLRRLTGPNLMRLLPPTPCLPDRSRQPTLRETLRQGAPRPPSEDRGWKAHRQFIATRAVRHIFHLNIFATGTAKSIRSASTVSAMNEYAGRQLPAAQRHPPSALAVRTRLPGESGCRSQPRTSQPRPRACSASLGARAPWRPAMSSPTGNPYFKPQINRNFAAYFRHR